MRNTCNDCDAIDQITIRVDANDTFNGVTIITDILITMSISLQRLDSLTNRFDGFDGFDSNLDQNSEYKCGYVNNIDTSAISNTWYKICAVTLVVGLFLTTIYFVIKVADALPLNIILWIEFDVIIVAVIQSILVLAVQSSIGAVDCDTPVIYNVCCVFYYVFYFLFVYHIFENIHDMLLIK